MKRGERFQTSFRARKKCVFRITHNFVYLMGSRPRRSLAREIGLEKMAGSDAFSSSSPIRSYF